VHELLRREEIAAAATLDEVAGDRERPAAEADERLVGGQLGADQANRVERRLGRRDRVQAVDVCGNAERLLHHRPHALHELHVDSHREHRRHDVGEEHGRIDAVARHRLERHLGAEFRRSGQLEEPVALSERPVLRKRAAGLPHEPDRSPLDRLAPASADEKGFRHGLTLVPCPGLSSHAGARGRSTRRAPER
jgi:hypothetical protein